MKQVKKPIKNLARVQCFPATNRERKDNAMWIKICKSVAHLFQSTPKKKRTRIHRRRKSKAKRPSQQ